MTQSGNGHPLALHFHTPPERIVSLVPSMTESLFALGLGERVVGITDYCIRPEGDVDRLIRLGGPKNPRVQDILSLKPDLVVANMEENTRSAVEALEAEGVPVWVTFPKTVRQALDVLWTLAGLYQSGLAAARVESLEIALEWAQKAAEHLPPVRYFCPIWLDRTSSGQSWWMTFNKQTYADDLLHLLGGENVFAERERRYPLAADLGLEPPEDAGDRDTRYPRVSIQEIRSANPDLILLPDEPYQFTEAHSNELIDLLSETAAVRNGQIHQLDGSLITWHGTRLAQALQILPGMLQ